MNFKMIVGLCLLLIAGPTAANAALVPCKDIPSVQESASIIANAGMGGHVGKHVLDVGTPGNNPTGGTTYYDSISQYNAVVKAWLEKSELYCDTNAPLNTVDEEFAEEKVISDESLWYGVPCSTGYVLNVDGRRFCSVGGLPYKPRDFAFVVKRVNHAGADKWILLTTFPRR